MSEKQFTLLDIEAAFENKQKPVKEDVTIEKIVKKESISPFDFVKDIRITKHGDLLDTDENKKVWNTYLILKALSMSPDDISICNILNQYQSEIPKESMYTALIGLIKEDRTFYKYIKPNKKENNTNVDSVSRYYQISNREAQDYIDVMGTEWAKIINEKFESKGRIKK